MTVDLLAPPLVPHPGLLFRCLMALTVAAGCALLVAAAQFVSRFGVGNGFAVVLFYGLFWELPEWATGALPIAWEMSPWSVGISLSALVALAIGVSRFLRWQDWTEANQGDPPLRLPTAGIQPSEVAAGLLMLPATAAAWFDGEPLSRLAQALAPGTTLYLVTNLVLIAIAVPVFSALFFWRRRELLHAAQNRGRWLRARLLSATFLLGLAVAYHVLDRLVPGGARLLPGSLVVVIAVAIALDLAAEIRGRWRAPGGADLQPLEGYQDVTDALTALVATAPERGATMQGLHFRSLTYFFAPYVPVVILGRPAPSSIA